jgi:23S rRNA (adenine2503-C2)-methyltransferase
MHTEPQTPDLSTLPPSIADARPDPTRTPLRGLTRTQLEVFSEEVLGEKRFRGRQLFAWLHQKHAKSFDDMTDLSAKVRALLNERATLHVITPHQAFPTADGTTKLTFKLHDGAVIESVVIPAEKRVTLCISSQVGCAINCQFCLTARMGLVRHLSASEIVEQVAWAKALWEPQHGRRISNIVFMGMGEPLHNYESVTQALRVLLAEDGMNFSRRKVTVSTSGLVPAIDRLGTETDIRVNLAISLNATTDETRDKVMPINKKWNIEQLLGALRRYPMEARQRITFEYVMLSGVNDTFDDARRLHKMLQGIPHKVNLIPWNPFPGAPFARPEREDVDRFQRYLLDHSVNTTVRETRGLEAMAACGQLGQPGEANAWRQTLRDARKAARMQSAADVAAEAVEASAAAAAPVDTAPVDAAPAAQQAEGVAP